MKELDILIGSDNKCRLKVKSLTFPSKYKYGLFGRSFNLENSKLIDVLTYNKTTGDKTLESIISDNIENTVYLDIPEDGWITLSHIVLPSKEWVELNKEYLNYSKDYYIYCADNSDIYRYFEGMFYKISPDILVLQNNTDYTTTYRVEKDYVSICFLKQCYINLCLQIFNELCGLNNSKNKGCFSANIDKDLQTKRDLVWMGINVIKYMVQFNMLAEAERVIELLESCNGICSGNPSTTNKSSGCGCSKK